MALTSDSDPITTLFEKPFYPQCLRTHSPTERNQVLDGISREIPPQQSPGPEEFSVPAVSGNPLFPAPTHTHLETSGDWVVLAGRNPSTLRTWSGKQSSSLQAWDPFPYLSAAWGSSFHPLRQHYQGLLGTSAAPDQNSAKNLWKLNCHWNHSPQK